MLRIRNKDLQAIPERQYAATSNQNGKQLVQPMNKADNGESLPHMYISLLYKAIALFIYKL